MQFSQIYFASTSTITTSIAQLKRKEEMLPVPKVSTSIAQFTDNG